MKYYVTDGVERAVVEAKDEIDACIKSVKHYFYTLPIAPGINYTVSEKGFRGFLGVDDTLVPVDLILQKIMDESDENA